MSLKDVIRTLEQPAVVDRGVDPPPARATTSALEPVIAVRVVVPRSVYVWLEQCAQEQDRTVPRQAAHILRQRAEAAMS